MRSGSGPKVTASLAVLAGLLAAVLVVTSSRGAARVSLLTRDPDAPTPSEVEYAHKMIEHQMDIHSGKKQHAGKGRLQQAFMVPQTQLEKQNIVLKKRVFGLEHEVRELSADLTAKGHHHLVKHALRHAQSSVGRAAIQAPLHTQTLHGQTKQMQWAQEALEEMKAKASKPATEAKPATKVPEPALKAMRPVRKMTTLAAAGRGGRHPLLRRKAMPIPSQLSSRVTTARIRMSGHSCKRRSPTIPRARSHVRQLVTMPAPRLGERFTGTRRRSTGARRRTTSSVTGSTALPSG